MAELFDPLEVEKTKATAAVRKKINQARELKRRGKELYVKANNLIDELIDEIGPGVEIDLGRGRVAVIADRYARGNVAFQQTAHSRYEIQVFD